jgi:hypothetical protein
MKNLLCIFLISGTCLASADGSNRIVIRTSPDEMVLRGSTIDVADAQVEVGKFHNLATDHLTLEVTFKRPTETFPSIWFTISAPLGGQFETKTYDFVRETYQELPRNGGLQLVYQNTVLAGSSQTRFQIKELVFNNSGQVTQLAVDFQTIENFSGIGRGLVSGAVRFHSSADIPAMIDIPAEVDVANQAHSSWATYDSANHEQHITNADGNFYLSNSSYTDTRYPYPKFERIDLKYGSNYGGPYDGQIEIVSGPDEPFARGFWPIDPYRQHGHTVNYISPFFWYGPSVGGTPQSCEHVFHILEVIRDSSKAITQFAADDLETCHVPEQKYVNEIRYHSLVGRQQAPML